MVNADNPPAELRQADLTGYWSWPTAFRIGGTLYGCGLVLSLIVPPRPVATMRGAVGLAVGLVSGLALVALVWPVFERTLPAQTRGENPSYVRTCWTILGIGLFAATWFSARTGPTAVLPNWPIVSGYSLALLTMFYRTYRWLSCSAGTAAGTMAGIEPGASVATAPERSREVQAAAIRKWPVVL